MEKMERHYNGRYDREKMFRLMTPRAEVGGEGLQGEMGKEITSYRNRKSWSQRRRGGVSLSIIIQKLPYKRLPINGSQYLYPDWIITRNFNFFLAKMFQKNQQMTHYILDSTAYTNILIIIRY